MHKFNIVLGDWSDDGHGKTKKILIESNFSHEDLQKAYLESHEKTNITFHNNDGTKIKVCVDYEQSQLTVDIYEALAKFDCPFDNLEIDGIGEASVTIDNCEDCYFNEHSYLNLLMWFISLSMPSDFTWKKVDDNIPNFNGYWDEKLNITLGYGLYQ